MKNRETYVVYIIDCWAVPGYSILKTVPAIRNSNMLKLGEFVHYKTKPVSELLGVCEQISTVREVSAIIFLDILKTDSVRHAGEVLKTMRSTIESTSNQGQCLKSLEISKEEFYVFRRVKSENS